MDDVRLGIDLGTTNSVVAVVRGPKPEVLLDTNDRAEIKSIVGPSTRGKTVVGEVAYDNWPLKPRDTIYSVKRLIGRGVAEDAVERAKARALYEIVKPSDGTERGLRVVMDGKEYSPVDISAAILKKMREAAEYRLGREITHAVITVPAYFSQKQKAATREAAQQAGLTPMRILEEPTAAAIAFGMDRIDSGAPARNVLVYDLGGGTFDISVLMWAGQTFLVMNKQGDMWLGGDDFDEKIMDRVNAQIKVDHGIDPLENLRFQVELRKAARKVKEQLSEMDSAPLILTGILHDAENNLIDVAMDITRKEFEEMSLPMVARTMELTARALEDAQLSPEDVDAVLVAGGASRMPMIREAVEGLFGKDKVRRDVHPKQCVAMGAAVVAHREGRIICDCDHPNALDAETCEKCGTKLTGDEDEQDVQLAIVEGTPFNYGIQLAGDRMAVFVRKNDGFPTPGHQRLWQTFHTQTSNQRILQIPVYGGDDEERASANEHQGEACALLPARLPKNTAVRIKLWLDGDGTFELDVKLDNNASVPFGLLRGEKDHAALEALAAVQRRYFDALRDADPGVISRLETGMTKAFDLWARGSYDEAIEKAGELDKEDTPPPGEGGDDNASRLRRLIGYAEMIVEQFSWVMDADKVFRLKNLISDAKDVLREGDEGRLSAMVVEIDRETDDFGKAANTLVGVRMAIVNGIGDADPVKANSYLTEMNALTDEMKQGNTQAIQKFNELQERLGKDLERIRGEIAEGVICPNCGQDPGGGLICQHCGHNPYTPK